MTDQAHNIQGDRTCTIFVSYHTKKKKVNAIIRSRRARPNALVQAAIAYLVSLVYE
jgi:hypothetical protein